VPPEFFSSIKTAATSPYALIAYVCLLAAWVYIAARGFRLRQISKIIMAVPENDRAALLAKEYNTTPRKGLSAEQWIRSRKQMLLFLAFIALVVAVAVVAVTTILTATRGAQGQARIRILDVVPVVPSQSGAAFPGINIYYDNAGAGVARGIVNRFAAGFGNGQLTDERIIAEQDKLLQWDGWQSEMDRRKQYEIHPGDLGEFTSIPNMEGSLAADFRSNWDKVKAGTSVLYVFITFKYFDPSGGIGVTENCFWFSGGFARHDCGRGRTFIEHK